MDLGNTGLELRCWPPCYGLWVQH